MTRDVTIQDGIGFNIRMLQGLYYQKKQTIRLRVNPTRIKTPLLAVEEDYYLTSNKGIYVIRDGVLYQLTSFNTYGLAFSEGYAYCSLYIGSYSCVVRFKQECLTQVTQTMTVQAEIMYGALVMLSNRDRIHQVTAVNSGPVWAANTGRNTLTKLVSKNGTITLKEFAPLVDRFNAPTLFDHNHLNSVVDYGAYQLFSAFRAGNGAVIGVIEQDKVTGYFYKNKGIHDIFLTVSGFILCDMLGDELTKGGLVTEDGFDNNPLQAFVQKYAVRGIAGVGDEICVGLSCKKEDHNLRMKGNARVAIMNQGACTDSLLLPCSQIYHIVHASQDSFPAVPPKTCQEVHTMFHNIFGSPAYEGTLLPVA